MLEIRTYCAVQKTGTTHKGQVPRGHFAALPPAGRRLQSGGAGSMLFPGILAPDFSPI
ncbi:protein of unknown function [Azospirillum lipoferum 4B]|uniref:Uncharacterized protein n=1 Tax=Azospirillum lipoferum (strain 4B) TaxID=862719 RepID=G7Z5J0_AZOL4|nr:protein of unknown function [Azospirillum lipoferum 4B]